MKIFFILLFIMTVLCSQCSNRKNANITILCTTDIHGTITGYSFESQRDTNISLSNISYYIKTVREKDSEIILLDGGDFLHGEPTNSYYNYVDTTSLNIQSVAMNEMKYDATTVGNHDIEAGHAVYDKVRSECHFPWVSANAIRTDNGLPYFKPYVIIERKGIRIAVLGMTTAGIRKWLPNYLWEGMAFTDMIECARQWVPYIHTKEQPDLLIGLFHSGYDYTYDHENAETPCNENATQLIAQQIDGFDAIIYGHDHSPRVETIINQAGHSVTLINPGSRSNNVGRLDIELSEGQKSIRAELIQMNSTLKDSTYESVTMPYIKKVKSYNLDTIGFCTQEMNARDAAFGESTFTDLVHTVQLQVTGADISFTSPMRLETIIHPGKITVGDIFKIYRFDNYLYIMSFTGEEIRRFLEYSASLQYNTMTTEGDRLLRIDSLISINGKRTYHTEVHYYHYVTAAGIRYSVDVSKPKGQRITIHEMSDGTAFSMEKTYRVAVNSYRGNGGGKHVTLGVGWDEKDIKDHIIKVMPKYIRFYITDYIREQQTIVPKLRNEQKIIPETWVKKAIKKEYNLLFSHK